MATTVLPIHETGFQVGATKVAFGLLWPDASFLMTDWTRPSRFADLDGINGTTTQFFGFGPRRASYAVYFDTVATFRALESLQQQTGTLSLLDGGHTLPVDGDERVQVAPQRRAYDRVDGVTLLSLVSTGVAPDGSVEAVATFQADR